MKIQPVSSPSQIKEAPSVDRKAAAIAAFNRSGQVVQNQTAVSPEEMGAIAAPPQKLEEIDIPVTDEATDNAELTAAPGEETPPQAAPEAKDPALSRQFAQLARQERMHRDKVKSQEAQFKAREEAIKQREAQLQSPSVDLSKYIAKDKLLQDPISVIEESGMSYDDITQRYIAKQNVDPVVMSTIQKLQAKIESLEKANEEGQKNQLSAQDQQYKAALSQIDKEAKKLVFTDPAFETIKATNSVSDVVDLIELTYKESGELLSVEDAAQQVEDYLIEEGIKLAKIQKIQNRLKAASNSQQSNQAKTQQPNKPQTQMKTLTNSVSSNRQLSAKERAILAFKGELKS